MPAKQNIATNNEKEKKRDEGKRAKNHKFSSHSDQIQSTSLKVDSTLF